MPTIDHFLDIFDAVSRKDWDEVNSIADTVAEYERKKRHFSAAARIRDAASAAIESNHRSSDLRTSASEVFAAPIDLLMRGGFQAAAEPILPDWLESELSFLDKEWGNKNALLEKSIFPRNTVLLHGAPGCGKTMLAHHIAARLKREIYTVKFDTLVSSFLGETGSNIKKVFQFAGANNCVLFLDEIDAIGKLRDDGAELGELKRVVVTLLQNIDSLSKNSFLIAATNHAHILDPAIWRRFEIVWELQAPKDEVRKRILESHFVEAKSDSTFPELVELTKGMTGAELTRVINESRRKLVFFEDLTPIESFVLSMIEHVRRFTGDLAAPANESNLKKIIDSLKRINRKKYTYAKLEEITGISHSTLHHRMKK